MISNQTRAARSFDISNHAYDLRPNCTPLSSITIIKLSINSAQEQVSRTDERKHHKTNNPTDYANTPTLPPMGNFSEAGGFSMGPSILVTDLSVIKTTEQTKSKTFYSSVKFHSFFCCSHIVITGMLGRSC